MKILVTGDRNWGNPHSVANAILNVIEESDIQSLQDVIIVHGAATGADTFASQFAELFDCQNKPYPAHWRHTDDCPSDCKRMVGRPAGVIRNQQMLDENPDIDIVLAFHPNLSESKGTKDMVSRVKKARISLLIFDQ
jgi:hypothetical protein